MVELRELPGVMESFAYQSCRKKPPKTHKWLDALTGIGSDDDDVSDGGGESQSDLEDADASCSEDLESACSDGMGGAPSAFSDLAADDSVWFDEALAPVGDHIDGADGEAVDPMEEDHTDQSDVDALFDAAGVTPTPSSSSSSSSSSSTSSSSSGAVEPVAAADVPGMLEPPPPKGKADEVIRTRWGVLRIYTPLSGRAYVVAHCNVHGSKCRLTRSLRAGHKVGQGKPLGFVLYWLSCSSFENIESAEHHVRMFDPSSEPSYPFPAKAQRLALRHEFKLLPGAQQFVDAEASGGDSENEHIE
jgi:hypothetical protein